MKKEHQIDYYNKIYTHTHTHHKPNTISLIVKAHTTLRICFEYIFTQCQKMFPHQCHKNLLGTIVNIYM